MGDGVSVLAGPDVEECRSMLGQGRVAEALAALESLARLEPDNADAHHYLGVALHLAGRSTEGLVHFAHAIARDPTRPSFHQNHSIALLTAGRTADALEAAERCLELRPTGIGGYVNKALALARLGRPADAEQTVLAGLALAPQHPGLMAQAAHLAIELQHWDDAEARVAAALKVAPDNVEVLYNAGVLHQARGREEKAIQAFDAVLKANPKHEAAFANKGVSLRNLGHSAAAIRHFSAGLAIWPDWNVLKYNLAITRLFDGAWTEAWGDYGLRGQLAAAFDKSPRPDSPVWDGSELGEGVLLVVHEQGFGDTFQFIRFLALARRRALNLVFVCQKRLYNVLSRLDLFRNLSVRLIADDQPMPEHVMHAYLMSLPGLLGVTPANVPIGVSRIGMETERLKTWTDFGAAAPGQWRIGLSWQGNPAAGVDRGRSVPVAALAPLASLQDKARFISLQRHFGTEAPFPDGLDVAVPGADFDAGANAFLDTAAMMMTLDLVITSDTAVAHLAGTLGRPVWLLLKKVPDWRWGLHGQLTPWYPTMRIFRQTTAGDWATVMAEVAADLDRLIALPDAQSQSMSDKVPEAIRLHMQGRYNEAAAIYEQARGARKGDAQFLNFYAMAQLEGGRRNAAGARAGLPLALHSTALKTGNSDFWSNAAVLLDSLGSRRDSIQALRFGLMSNPDHIPSVIALAKKESADGQSESALKTLLALAGREGVPSAVFSALSAVYSDLKRPKDAARALRRALELEPENAKFWVQLGAVQSADEQHDASADSWERALFHEPENADALSNLGVYERNHGDLGLSVYLQRRAVECDPLHAEGWNNLGIAELEACREPAAIGAFRRALTVRPGYPDAHLALGMALLNGGDYEHGLRHYEWRLKADKLGISSNRPNIRPWTGGDPRGLSFFLMAEQGFGDAFQFSRYAAWLKERGATQIFVGCRKQIGHLLQTIPGVDGIYSDGAKLPKVDVMAYMMSMPALTGLRLETIPAYDSYMTADPVRVTCWAQWLAQRPGFRVGIVWQGNPDPKVDKGRSYPLAALEPLAAIPGVRLIALQKGRGEEQIAALNGRFEVEQPGEDFDTGPDAFGDTAAMMMNLDLVVTSDTAVAHLAGALGRPCWVILKSHPEWRWLKDRSDSPWYPATRLFRRIQDEVEERPFAAVIGRLAAALARLAAGDLSQRHVTAPAAAGDILPHDPARIYNRAHQAQKDGDHAAARAGFAEVLDAKPLRPAALHMLGVLALHADRNHRAVLLFREAGRHGLATPEFLTNYSIALRRTGSVQLALANLDKAIEIKPSAEAYLSRGNILRDECRFEEAKVSYETAITLRPDLSKAHRGLGNLMRDMHRPEQSLAAFARARALDSSDPDLILDQAHAKLFAGDFIGGFIDYEARWGSKEMKARQFNVPRWDGSAQPDKTLLVHGEQGFGDNIQFARFIDEATRRVGTVKVEVRGPLVSLFRTIATAQPVEILEQGQHKTAFDLEVPMLSLPRVFGTTVETVPAPADFRIDPERVAAWRERFSSPNFKVGLIWQGNPKARADQGRSPPLSELAPLFAIPGIQFVSLQKSDGIEQIRQSPFAAQMIVLGKDLGDFRETAAAILALDLVVSSCTATLHLAATLGVPVLGMLKYHADWRWLNERADSPWYPTIRLFRQSAPFDWPSVVEPLAEALAARVAAERRVAAQ
jgi:tetratricopeptide (TPR) repeat protein